MRHVGQLGDRGVERVPVVVHQRHPPQGVPAGIGRGEQIARHPVVAGVERGQVRPEGHPGRPGQRGDVHHDVGLEHRVGVGERVGQDQAAFRVGVQHLDGAAAEMRDDIPRTQRRPGRHVLRRGHQPGHPRLDPEPGQSGHDRDHDRAAGHVGLHQLHAIEWLERQAAAVERDALADQHDMPMPLRRPVTELDQARRAG